MDFLNENLSATKEQIFIKEEDWEKCYNNDSSTNTDAVEESRSEVKCGEIIIRKIQQNNFEVKFQCKFCLMFFKEQDLENFFEHIKQNHYYFNFKTQHSQSRRSSLYCSNINDNNINVDEIPTKDPVSSANVIEGLAGELQLSDDGTNDEVIKSNYQLRKSKQRINLNYSSTSSSSPSNASKDLSNYRTVTFKTRNNDQVRFQKKRKTSISVKTAKECTRNARDSISLSSSENDKINKKKYNQKSKEDEDYLPPEPKVPKAEKVAKKKGENRLNQLKFDGLWECKRCNVVLSENITRREHFMKSHKQKFVCYLCGKSNLRSQTSLEDHIAGDHQGIRQYQCRMCSLSFKTAQVRKAHEQSHIREKLFKCEHCFKSYRSSSNLKYHLMKHTVPESEYPHKCPACPKAFLFSRELNSHLETRHNTQKDLPHKCDSCSKAYRCKKGLRTHVRLEHLGEFNYECPYCGKKYIKKHEMEMHKISHEGKQFKCDLCESIYSNKNSLRKHKNQKHPDSNSQPKTYLCEKCNSNFKSSAELTKHHKIHFIEEKIFGCLICESRHDSKPGLNSHYVKSHTEVGNFICDICSKCFTVQYKCLCHKLYTHELFK